MATNKFTLVAPNHVSSDDGYSVERTGRSTLVYRRGALSLEIEVEIGGPLGVYLTYSAEKRGIERSEIERIKKDLAAALPFIAGKFEIE